MTTESKRDPAPRGLSTLLGAAGSAFCGGVVCAVLGLAVHGADAFTAGLAGSLLATAVFLGGAAMVDLVAREMPAASLLVALMTYALQLATVTALLAVLIDGGLVTGTGADWLAAAVIVVTLAWSAAHLVLTTRRRTPLYDLSLPGASGGSGRVRGER